uniref:Myb/SANT-like DNA-binding domain-containing protein n=1 Tax=Bactrocera dorsalis TaxID=27457 RepID=A0A034W572_BACDO
MEDLANEPERPRNKWKTETIKCILEIWKEYLYKMVLEGKSDQIFEQMSTEMENFGYNFSPREISAKLSQLTNAYRIERRKIKNGPFVKSDWPFYKALDFLVGNSRVHQWDDLMEDIEDLEDEESSESDGAAQMEDGVIDLESEEGSVMVSTSNKMFKNPSLEMQVSSEESENETSPKPNPCVPNLQASMSALQKSVNNLQNNKVKIQNLTAAKLELIELQKESVKKEMEYRRAEFQQRTEEFQLRMKQMKEEHDWRMTDIRSRMEKEFL